MNRNGNMKRINKFENNKCLMRWKKSEFRKKLLNSRLVSVMKETRPYKVFRYRVLPHLYLFWIPWILLSLMLVVTLFDFPWKLSVLALLMFLFVAALVIKPMNVIHGMIGTRGNIVMFFVMFFFINFLISSIYYNGFFRNAGITYDVSQPHVEYNIFKGFPRDTEAIVVDHGEAVSLADGQGVVKHFGWEGDPVFFPKDWREMMMNKAKAKAEHHPSDIPVSAHYYHRIRYTWVLQNTLLTSLMQEPTEFYSFTCTYSGDHKAADKNIKLTRSFHWFLVFHILISWIFLGVFISLIYQKFRNN